MSTPNDAGDHDAIVLATDTVSRLQDAVDVGRPIPIPGTMEPRPAVKSPLVVGPVVVAFQAAAPVPEAAHGGLVSRSALTLIERLISMLRTKPAA